LAIVKEFQMMITRFKSAVVLLLSLLVAGSVSAARRPPVPPPPPPKPALHGSVQGNYTHPPNVDGPITYLLQGAGTVTPLGKVTAAGSITVKGFGPGAGSNGVSLTLTDKKGTVTLSLAAAGPTFPGQFQYTVSAATGVFAGLKGTTGTARFAATATGLQGGTFMLTLK
jgi:hypothetical protein